MADESARTEYPTLLASLQPTPAVMLLNDRVRRINKLNLEIADWMQERRRVEEQYVMGLRKLAQYKVPNSQSELGIFSAPWDRIVSSVENIAVSHHQFASLVEKDVEMPLRAFQQRGDITNLSNISGNLASLARDLDDAREKSGKLGKKGGKASTQKVGAASSRLDSATQQWESQAPFVFESLQALDESRLNYLREMLTQYQTHESDQAQRAGTNAADTLAVMLDINIEREVHDFARRTSNAHITPLTRLSASAHSQRAETASPPPPSIPRTATAPAASTLSPVPTLTTPVRPQLNEDSFVDQDSVPTEVKQGSKLRRLGTLLGGGRRRQSVHGGFGLSPQKTPSFGRAGSSHGRGISPRASFGNLRDGNRLTSLAETPDMPPPPPVQGDVSPMQRSSFDRPNGVTLTDDGPTGAAPPAVNGTNAVNLSDVSPPPGPPSGLQSPPPARPAKDAEGFTIPAAMNDPISEAQREAAADEAEQMFKLNIQNKPVAEEDPDAKQAALSNVANSLKIGPATRRQGTIRGRRDVRNTIYVPSPTDAQPSTAPGDFFGGTPSASPVAAAVARPMGLNTLASEASITGTSDTQSVRSGYSLGNLTQAKHPDITDAGFNASIIETVSAVFEDGAVTSATIAGEIAFVNNPTDPEGSSRTHETIKINNFANLERIGPNRIFVMGQSSDQPDRFTLDVSHLTKMATAFSYRVFANESDRASLGKNAPLLLKPTWKPQGDKLGLLLQYQLNSSETFAWPITLRNVVLVATYDGKATGAQTKPSGIHLKEKHLVYWRLGDVTLTEESQRIVCRILGADGVAPTPGHVEARWEYSPAAGEAVGSGISISRLEESKGKEKEVATDDNPFADDDAATPAAGTEGTWTAVPLSRKLIGGKYEGR